MLFTEGLEEILFQRHRMNGADEFVILSGYLGPSPVKRLTELPFNTTVVYGMYGAEKIRQQLHETLIQLHSSQVNILYSSIPVHSKCYIWKKEGKIIHALVGSANFSKNGLSTPYREVLAETTYDTFHPLDQYIEKIIKNSIVCSDHSVKTLNKEDLEHLATRTDSFICEISLLDPKTGMPPNSSGINWGQSERGNVNFRDAYIPVRKEHIRQYPNLFPPKQEFPLSHNSGRPHRHNDSIEIIWDDGTTMEGLFEGSQDFMGLKYPKQISSSPKKCFLGDYLRNRLGVESGVKVIKEHFDAYGRSTISVSLQAEGVYFFDFSVPKQSQA